MQSPSFARRAALLLAALSLPTSAFADALVDNVNGITLDQNGKVVRFTGVLI
jgi:hypothetical protein